jgi:hypothetical protein
MPKASHASAKLYSLIETARGNGIEPYTNLVDVITKLPSTTTDDKLDRLLPWNQDETILVWLVELLRKFQMVQHGQSIGLPSHGISARHYSEICWKPTSKTSSTPGTKPRPRIISTSSTAILRFLEA